uniref:Ig-like domain-containing protein n=1 Tax=Chelonoidis abingdonii TaxID=106734 RepID=A0A8C0G362_CHEAB
WDTGSVPEAAGSNLLLLTKLSSHPPTSSVLGRAKSDCHFTNGTERVRFLDRHIYNRQQLVHFDSDVGVYVGDTELGRDQAELWNKNPAKLAHARAAVDTFCRNNYEAAVTVSVQPKVKVSPTKSESEPHPHLLVCSVTGFYPGGIEIKWLKNGQEQTAGVVSTELLQNGDWTFQILVMLEMSPQRGDVYTCQVEHISLRGPIAPPTNTSPSQDFKALSTVAVYFYFHVIMFQSGLSSGYSLKFNNVISVFVRILEPMGHIHLTRYHERLSLAVFY